jgi:spore photoproduct lyase
MPEVNLITEYISKRYPHFGINKRNEIIRLVYEIAKREGGPFRRVLHDCNESDFNLLKDELLERRYPESFKDYPRHSYYLPQLELDSRFAFKKGVFSLSPKKVYWETGVSNTYVLMQCKELFPHVVFKEISSLRDYMCGEEFSLTGYNQRRENLFIVQENQDFLKPCPCSPRSVSCGYQVWNVGFGCGYECAYCFLQGYQNVPGIILPANIEDFFRHFALAAHAKGPFGKVRVGSGEFTDSLLYDAITGFSSQIIDFFRDRPEAVFEFKTKSVSVDPILRCRPHPHIVVSWSVNPQRIVRAHEFYTPSLRARLDAASRCARAGFKVGFHFDPIVYYPEWERDYRGVVEYLFDRIPAHSLSWISLGSLRMNPMIKKIIENRFPHNSLLDGELVLGYDRKLRYPQKIRTHIYRKMKSWIRKRNRHVYLYLCMEEPVVYKAWEGAGGKPQ